MVTNPQTVSWANATQATDQNGNIVSWNATSDMAGVEIAFDGQAAVSVPASSAITSVTLKSVAGYSALPAGQHTLTVSDVTKEGAVSAPSQTVTFLIALVPMAPTNIQLA